MLVTSVTEKNIDAFRELIPEDIWYSGQKEKLFTLGVLSDPDENGRMKAVGTCVFQMKIEIDTENQVEMTVGEVWWFYIDREERDKGYADALLDELLVIMDQADVDVLVIDVSMTDEEDELVRFLEDNGFEFLLEERNELTTTLGDLEERVNIPKVLLDYIVPVCELSMEQKKRLENLLNEHENVPRSLADFDEKISCVAFCGKRIDGYMLAEHLPSGMIEFAHFYNEHPMEKTFEYMLAVSIRRALKEHGEYTPVYLDCNHEVMIDLANRLLPEEEPNLVRRGYLFADEGGEE